MILTVTANPAIDVTYRLPELRPGQVHRVRSVSRREGGKGVNVARVLHQLGEPVTAVGFGDGRFGAELRAAGLDAEFVAATDAVRSTLVVHDEVRGATSLWEPGAPPRPGACDELLDLVRDRLGRSSVVVVSGSLPPGVPHTLPAEIAALARSAGLPVVVDVDDDALRTALERGGAVLVPNEDELERLAPSPDVDLHGRARALAARNGAPVVLTRGAHGLLAATGTESWGVSPVRAVRGNPTGAGDATAAGIALGLARGDDWPVLLHRAGCLGAAAVLSPVAGEVDLIALRDLLDLTPTIEHRR